MESNKHYIRTDANGYIIKSFSDAFEEPQDGDIFIKEGGRHYNLDLWDGFIPKFKYNDGIRECTQAEIDAYKASLAVQSTETEILRDYVLTLDYRLILMELGI